MSSKNLRETNNSSDGEDSPGSNAQAGGDNVENKDKNNEDGVSKTIMISILNQVGESMKFRVKRTSLVSRLIDCYCERKNVRKKELRFRFDGHAISDEATPESLNMEEGDIIEVFAEQIGGKMI